MHIRVCVHKFFGGRGGRRWWGAVPAPTYRCTHAHVRAVIVLIATGTLGCIYMSDVVHTLVGIVFATFTNTNDAAHTHTRL